MAVKKKDPRLITDWQEAIEVFEGHDWSEPMALDLETTGLSPWHASIAVVGLYSEQLNAGAALHFPRSDHERIMNKKRKLPPELVVWLSDPKKFFVAHNACGFDFYFLWEAGVNIFLPRWFDTLIAEGVVVKASRRDVRVRLKDAYKRQLGKDLKKDIDHTTWQNPELTREQLEYVLGDIVYLPELRRAQLAKIADDSRARAMDLEQDLMMVVARMVINGLPVDKEMFREQIAWMRDNRGTYELLARQLAGDMNLNLNSPAQLKAAFARLGRPIPGTAVQVLQWVRDGEEGPASVLAQLVLLYRLAKQRVNMYNDAFFEEKVLPVDGGHVVRARYWQVGTDTGRFSSSDPNLQQVAGDCRTYFGRLRGAMCATLDYSQLEVRIAAWLAQDLALLEALDAEDVHAAVAAAIFQKPASEVTEAERKLAKAGTFTFLFGGGFKLFHETARSQGSGMTLKDAEMFEGTFFERFTGLAAARAGARSAARYRKSVSVTMPHGLIRTLAGDTLKPTTILNTCVQGGAASGLKKALLLCRDYDVDRFLAGTVHDELIQIGADFVLGDGTEEPRPGDDPIGQVVSLTRMAMEQGMLWAFPGLVDGKPFPVKVGVKVLDHWAGPPPYTHETMMAKVGAHITLPHAAAHRDPQREMEIPA